MSLFLGNMRQRFMKPLDVTQASKECYFLNLYSMVFLINASFRVQKIKSKNQSKRFKCPEVETQLCFSYHFLFVVIFDFFSKTTGLISTKLDMKHFLVTGVYVFFLKNNFLKPIKLKSLYGSILR